MASTNPGTDKVLSAVWKEAPRGFSPGSSPLTALSCSVLRWGEGGSLLRCGSLQGFLFKALGCTTKAGEPAATFPSPPGTGRCWSHLSLADSEREAGVVILAGGSSRLGEPAQQGTHTGAKPEEAIASAKLINSTAPNPKINRWKCRGRGGEGREGTVSQQRSHRTSLWCDSR